MERSQLRRSAKRCSLVSPTAPEESADKSSFLFSLAQWYTLLRFELDIADGRAYPDGLYRRPFKNIESCKRRNPAKS